MEYCPLQGEDLHHLQGLIAEYISGILFLSYSTKYNDWPTLLVAQAGDIWEVHPWIEWKVFFAKYPQRNSLLSSSPIWANAFSAQHITI